ncbi:MAG TPA: FAD:protein FMN transferase, partial [Longimicrobiales bacterium]|nr:FAD:protein FMN transferase [Longimicrobiales bacterium]
MPKTFRYFAVIAATACSAATARAQAPKPAADFSSAGVERTTLVEREAFVMGVRLGARITGPAAANAVEAALAEVRRVDDLLTTWRPEGELSRANEAARGGAARLSPELAGALAEVGSWVARTGGAFDPSIGALLDAWGVRGEPRTPGAEELEAARSSAGWSRVTLDPAARTLTMGAGVWLEAGGFGKGLALREAAEALAARGSSGLLNFGGQIVVVGGPETVGVADLAARGRSVADLLVSDASVSTTSGSERPGHVIDPRTGQPVPSWGSVTVVAEDALVADILSTALFVMGADAALAWSRELPYGVLVQERTDQGVHVRTNPGLERWRARSAERMTTPSKASSAAQDTTEIERLKAQVDAITRELERMRLGGDVVARADTGVLGFGPAASKVYKVAEGVSVGGYGEVLYRWQADELEDGTASETLNRWDALRAILYVGYRFTDRLLFNSEIEIEHADEAYLEFAYLDYRLSDALGLRGGLLLAPIGL